MASDEIALGALTAKRLGLDVGVEVVVKTLYGDREATIRGLVVLWVSIVVAVTGGIGLVAAAGPGRRAARVPAGEILHHE